MLTIHNFPRGGRGLRIAWLCEEMGLAYRMAAVSFPPSADYLALNPLGSVPFLEDDANGVAINESVAQLLYLAEQYGPTPLLPARGDPALGAVMQLGVFSEASLGAMVNVLLADRFGAPEADKGGWAVRMADNRVNQAVDYLSGKLDGRDFLVGEDLTVADIAIVTMLGVWRAALGRTAPDNLAAYLERMAARPAYQRASAATAGA